MAAHAYGVGEICAIVTYPANSRPGESKTQLRTCRLSQTKKKPDKDVERCSPGQFVLDDLALLMCSCEGYAQVYPAY